MFRTFVLTLALLGCGGGEDPADTGDDEPAVFAPSYGDWQVDAESESGTCDFGEDTGDTGIEDDGAFTVTDNGNGTFQLYDAPEGDEEGIDVTCTLTDKDFICEEVTMPTEDMGDLDATLILTQLVSGTFTDADNFSGKAEIEATCEGADCDQLAAFGVILPCNVLYDITASFAG